jgi:hypothetical protein
MARTAKPANNSTIPVQDVVGPLIDDYVSQTDVTNQAIASNLTFATGKYPFADQYLIPKISVFKEGSNYRVLDSDGSLLYNGSSFEVAMNDYAFAGLTGTPGAIEKVYVKGNMTVDDTILLPSNLDLEVYGKWTAANALNKAMIMLSGTKNYNIFVGGRLLIDGNSAGQTGGADRHALHFVCSEAQTYGYTDNVLYFPTIQLDNIFVEDPTDSAYYMDYLNGTGNTLGMYNCGGTAGSEDLCVWEYLSDSDLIGGLYSGDNVNFGLRIKQCSCSSINPSYLNGHHQINDSTNIDFKCKFLDNNGNFDTLNLWGATYSVFHDSIFRRNGGTDNTYNGVLLDNTWGAAATNNVFSNLVFRSTGANSWKYAIEESDNTQDSNQYCNINAGDAQTGALRLLGAVSKVQHQNIVGTVAEA